VGGWLFLVLLAVFHIVEPGGGPENLTPGGAA
jgi:hypothetical protein